VSIFREREARRARCWRTDRCERVKASAGKDRSVAVVESGRRSGRGEPRHSPTTGRSPGHHHLEAQLAPMRASQRTTPTIRRAPDPALLPKTLGRFVFSLVLVVGCQSGGIPITADAGRDLEAELVPCRSADQFSGSRKPNDPCAVDSDCHDPYLSCTTQKGSMCRDGNAVPEQTGCPSSIPTDIPICPTSTYVALRLCDVRFGQACFVDADCGPAGFLCRDGGCQPQSHGPCTTNTDCPSGWTCADSCPGTSPDAGAPRSCLPPFSGPVSCGNSNSGVDINGTTPDGSAND
jgi:hypothetical protein